MHTGSDGKTHTSDQMGWSVQGSLSLSLAFSLSLSLSLSLSCFLSASLSISLIPSLSLSLSLSFSLSLSLSLSLYLSRSLSPSAPSPQGLTKRRTPAIKWRDPCGALSLSRSHTHPAPPHHPGSDEEAYNSNQVGRTTLGPGVLPRMD